MASLRFIIIFIILSFNLIFFKISPVSITAQYGSSFMRKLNETTNCRDPTTEELGELMFNFEKKFDGNLNFLDVEAAKRSIGNLVILDSFLKVEPFVNEKKCAVNRNSNEHNKGLCSWHNIFTYREHHYPHILMQAICNCPKCDSVNRKINDFEFSCQPLKKIFPALTRGKCNLNNKIYEWKPALEYVSIACMCMRNGTNYPVS